MGALGLFSKAIRKRGERLAVLRPTSFTERVQFELFKNSAKRSSADPLVIVNGRPIPLSLVPNRRARRYVLRLRPDGSARVTIPRGGSIAEGLRFAERHGDWLEKQIQKLAAGSSETREWRIGTEIWFRGERVKIEQTIRDDLVVQLGREMVSVSDSTANLRPAIENHLWKLAATELPSIVIAFATLHGLPVRRVTVRNQRSRWGSCSPRGTISLNWRLIQTPPNVRDYIILHELCHLREMNHSSRFWEEVERVCPGYARAEKWLRRHGHRLR